MSEQSDHLSTLPQRMRWAAQVLREADKRYGAAFAWKPYALEVTADRWEAEDHKGAERDGLEKELLKDLCEALVPGLGSFISAAGSSTYADEILDRTVRGLLDSGWRKGESS